MSSVRRLCNRANLKIEELSDVITELEVKIMNQRDLIKTLEAKNETQERLLKAKDKLIRDLTHPTISFEKKEAEIEHDGCEGCEYMDKDNTEEPCNRCKQAYLDQYKHINCQQHRFYFYFLNSIHLRQITYCNMCCSYLL